VTTNSSTPCRTTRRGTSAAGLRRRQVPRRLDRRRHDEPEGTPRLQGPVRPAGKVVDLVPNHDHKFFFLDNVGTTLYFRTDFKAKKNQVIAIDLTKPDPANWKTVVAETKDTLEFANLMGDAWICSYLQDAKTAVKLYDLAGKFVRDVELPGIGTAAGFGGKRTDGETFYSFSSFNTPPSTYRYDPKTGQTRLLKSPKVRFDPNQFEVKQVFYPSKDGTKIPMFVTTRRG